jgi:hypothetical protein
MPALIFPAGNFAFISKKSPLPESKFSGLLLSSFAGFQGVKFPPGWIIFLSFVAFPNLMHSAIYKTSKSYAKVIVIG